MTHEGCAAVKREGRERGMRREEGRKVMYPDGIVVDTASAFKNPRLSYQSNQYFVVYINTSISHIQINYSRHETTKFEYNLVDKYLYICLDAIDAIDGKESTSCHDSPRRPQPVTRLHRPRVRHPEPHLLIQPLFINHGFIHLLSMLMLSPKLLPRLEFDPWTSLPITALLIDLRPPPLEILHDPRVGEPKEDHHHRDGQS